MAITHVSLLSVLDRAVQDPIVLADLAANPLAAAERWGARVTAEDLKILLGVPGATDAELVEVMRRRLTHHRTGCGGCTPVT